MVTVQLHWDSKYVICCVFLLHFRCIINLEYLQMKHLISDIFLFYGFSIIVVCAA